MPILTDREIYNYLEQNPNLFFRRFNIEFSNSVITIKNVKYVSTEDTLDLKFVTQDNDIINILLEDIDKIVTFSDDSEIRSIIITLKNDDKIKMIFKGQV